MSLAPPRRATAAFVALALSTFAVVVGADPSSSQAATIQPSSTGSYAPLDRPGPALMVSPDMLATSLRCVGDLKQSREPVLLVPATGVNSKQNFSWNYEIALRERGIAYCASDQPGIAANNMGDIQNRADYVVYAIRTMYESSGHKIAVIGASQGGLAARWPLRFWPDTRQMVADVIALDSPNHGTTVINAALCAVPCTAALQQQRAGSAYTGALNSGQETFAGISYTNISSVVDDFVEPNTFTDSTVWLDGPGEITNVAIQSVCRNALAPGNLTEHLITVSTNPVTAALAFDAITNPGPAKPERISQGACNDGLFMQGVPLTTSASGLAAVLPVLAGQLALAVPKMINEPVLRCYTQASCGAAKQ